MIEEAVFYHLAEAVGSPAHLHAQWKVRTGTKPPRLGAKRAKPTIETVANKPGEVEDREIISIGNHEIFPHDSETGQRIKAFVQEYRNDIGNSLQWHTIPGATFITTYGDAEYWTDWRTVVKDEVSMERRSLKFNADEIAEAIESGNLYEDKVFLTYRAPIILGKEKS